MKPYFSGLLTVLLCLGASSSSAQDTEPEVTSPPAATINSEAYVDGIVEAMMNEHQLPGLMVAITDRDQDRLLKGYGQADVEGEQPVDQVDTLFRIGSISKTFTWTAVMMLVDRGQLELDRDVNDYLEALQIDAAFDAPITMNDLMAHRAGFEDTLRVFQSKDDDPRSLGEV
ncbi:MAG: serine hydrolase domain-containing protein, partial [Pseudomonadota bacterium]